MAERDTFNGQTVFTLSDVAMSIHNVIEKTYNRLYYIKAEILKLNYYPYSGHCYPELVEREGDKVKAEMRAIIWSSRFNEINERFLKITGDSLKENLSILCLASVQFSPKHGLALHIEDIEPTFTLGEMQKNRQEVIDKLKKEGVFHQNKSLKLPLLPKRIAIISVETSKGYSDFIKTIQNNRFDYSFKTELFPSILQGEKAISGMNFQLSEIKKRISDFDVVVIVRGGGGDVGLSCYDDYSLSKNIATFPLPVLTGIGHSTNTSVCDMVAYSKFITPTDVAFYLIQKFENFDAQIEDFISKISNFASLKVLKSQKELQSLTSLISLKTSDILVDLNNDLSETCNLLLFKGKEIIIRHRNEHKIFDNTLRKSSTNTIVAARQNLPLVFDKISRECLHILQTKKSECVFLEDKLKLLSPENILKRGYSITLLNGKAVTNAKSLKKNDVITTKFFDGDVVSEIK